MLLCAVYSFFQFQKLCLKAKKTLKIATEKMKKHLPKHLSHPDQSVEKNLALYQVIDEHQGFAARSIF